MPTMASGQSNVQDAVHDAEGAKTTTRSRAPAPKTGYAEAPGPEAIGGPTRVSSESPVGKSCGVRDRTGSLLSCRWQTLTQVQDMVLELKARANSASPVAAQGASRMHLTGLCGMDHVLVAMIGFGA